MKFKKEFITEMSKGINKEAGLIRERVFSYEGFIGVKEFIFKYKGKLYRVLDINSFELDDLVECDEVKEVKFYTTEYVKVGYNG